MRLKALAAALPWAMSGTMARLMTMPAAPVNAWTNRAATSHSTLGASAHATEAPAQATRPASRGPRRP